MGIQSHRYSAFWRLGLACIILIILGNGTPHPTVAITTAPTEIASEPTMHILAFDPHNSQRIFAHNSGGWLGLFRSNDGGETWQRIFPDTVVQLIIHPIAPSIMFGQTRDKVVKSIDGGNTWTVISHSNLRVSSLVASTSPSFVLHTHGYFNNAPEYQGYAIQRSIDNGATWHMVPIPTNEYNHFALHPYDSSRMYLSTSFNGCCPVTVSTDAGATWVPRSYMNLINGPLRFVSTDLDTIYQGVWFPDSRTYNIYKSTDNGLTWDYIVNTGYFNQFFHNELPAREPIALFDDTNLFLTINSGPTGTAPPGFDYGLNRSTDGGQTWTHVYSTTGEMDHTVDLLVQAPANHAQLYAVDQGRQQIIQSQDNGATWTAIGCVLQTPASVTPDPQIAGTLYIGTRNGLFKSTDNGATCHRLDFNLSNTSIADLVAHPTVPHGMYALTRFDGLYISNDDGGTWESIGSGLPSLDPRKFLIYTDLIVDPTNPMTMYAEINHRYQMYDGMRSLSSMVPAQVYKSTDGGAQWIQLTVPEKEYISSLTVDSGSPSTLYGVMSGEDLRDLYKSPDGGTTWIDTDTSIATGGRNIRRFLVSPISPTIMYVQNYDHTYTSVDKGQTWTQLDLQIAPTEGYVLHEIFMNPSNPDMLIIFIMIDGQILTNVSYDAGQTWERRGALPQEGKNMLFDPSDPALLYTTAGDYLYVSRDAGITWTRVTTLYNIPGLSADLMPIAQIERLPTKPGWIYLGLRNFGVVAIKPSSISVPLVLK